MHNNSDDGKNEDTDICVCVDLHCISPQRKKQRKTMHIS